MTDPRFDVFISYSTNDNEWVNRYLVPILQSWGLSVAIDSQVFLPGVKLDDHISGFLGASETVLFTCTEHFMASHWCQQEVAQVVADGSKGMIPLELDGPDQVPQLLKDQNVTWAHLTERQHEDGQWRKLCAALDGTWTDETDRVLDDLRDLGSFFGGFMNNRTITNVLSRSHTVVEPQNDLTGVDLDHMLGSDQVKSVAPVFTLLGRIGKVSRIEALLQNTFGTLSRETAHHTTENYIAIGGTAYVADLLDDLCGRSWDLYSVLGTPDGPLEIDWDWDGDYCFVYKSRTHTDGNLIFLFSPWGEGVQLAAEILLNHYWEFARHVKDREMLRIYRRDGDLARELLFP